MKISNLFRKTSGFTPAEIAKAIAEVLAEKDFDSNRQDRTDWMIEALERIEKREADGQFFQSIRAELFRLGVKHSNQL